MRNLRLCCLVALALFATSARSWASFGDFTYNATLTPGTIASPAGDMMVVLTGQTQKSLNAAGPGGVMADAGMICLMSEPTATGTETFGGQYTIDLFLTDTDSGKSATFALTPPLGLTAQISIPAGAPDSAVTTTDLPPMQSQVIGSTLYTVSAMPSDYFMQPGPPADKGAAGTPGGFMVDIAASPVPEPASVGLLGGLAALLIRRRRRVVPVVSA